MFQFTTFSQLIESLNEIIKTVRDSLPFKAAQAAYPRSFTEFTKVAKVEPLSIVSRDLLTVDYMPDIMGTLLNNFIGYYLQALAITTNVEAARIVRVLDRLNPDRDPTIGDYANVIGLGTESLETMPVLNKNAYQFRLPRTTTALEANGPKIILNDEKKSSKSSTMQRDSKGIPHQTQTEEESTATGGYGFDTNKIITEIANLAVGKYIDVTLTTSSAIVSGEVDNPNQVINRDEEGVPNSRASLPIKKRPEFDKSDKKTMTMTIPVHVRLAPMVIPNQSIEHILTINTDDNSIVERFHSWRAGRIRFIQDLIFCQDLIDAHKKALMSDESGAYTEIMRRATNSTKKGLLTSNPSLASASNLFVISDEVAKNIEFKLGGKLSNARIRQKAFENTYAMIIAVVHRDWERITFYYRGIATSTNVSIKEIKTMSKSKGPDILDIFKALNAGSAPSF